MGNGWTRRGFLHTTSAAGATVGITGIASAAPASGAAPETRKGRSGRMHIERTTVEYADTVLGTDSAAPLLGWELSASGHGARQSAYRIRVATSAEDLRAGRALVWDSGKVASDRTVAVPYAGRAPQPRTRYHWQVRVWDAEDRPSRWSAVRWWETALPAERWNAQWIGADPAPRPPGFDGASWIWSPGATTGNAPVGARWFRAVLELPAGAAVAGATVLATADDDFTLYLGGTQVLHAPEQQDGWRTGQLADVTAQASAAADGRILLAAVATNRGTGSVNPAGLLVRLLVDTADGERHELVTGSGWRTTDAEHEGWQRPDFDDSGWQKAAALARYGEGPWGDDVTVAAAELPAPLLRREFTLSKPVTRARLYISGIAYYVAEINGTGVGHQVLDPGFTDYDDTVLYTTHDVTELLRRGDNAIGVTLGRGFYGMTTPNVWNWHRPPWHGEPRLLCRLEADHPDGTRTTVVSDPDWRLADGPTLSNSLYAGETYDARRAPKGWTRPGFDDSGWRHPGSQTAPKGTLRAQPHDPIEIIDTLTPVRIDELRPGVYIADMGRTVAGWTRLTVRAPAGTTVALVHGEKLKADGSVHAETPHVPGRFQRDEYICAGGDAPEVWEPSFSYKGFRYVELHGLPGRPDPEDVRGRVVHTKVDEVSTFRCSEPFYERLDTAMRRTVLNNLHGIPTDTPMYEKNGWTGDAQLGAPIMTYAFGMQRLLGKWLGDLADGQTTEGQLPVIAPSGGWGYGDLGPSPEWTTVYPFVLRELYRTYGDDRAARAHWESVTRYLDWELSRLEDGLAITALGDYLAPGYGGNPPEDTRLTATAYLHRALLQTAELGDLLGHKETASRYRTRADRLKEAFNTTFLSSEGHYRTAKDPGYRQTSNALPLAFGLVPSEARASVVDSLLADIARRGNHLNTGALGTSVLLRVLCAQGHPDVAHAIATQRTYPSWGYWFDNGADTMWEMWPLDSRSRDHYFQGTVAQWLYENVAGLRPGDDGYRTFTVRPDARSGVDWARTGIRTVRGTAAVAWSRAGKDLRLTVTVPVGSTAEVHVPAGGRDDVTSDGGAAFLRTEPGFAVYRVEHGRWEFVGRP